MENNIDRAHAAEYMEARLESQEHALHLIQRILEVSRDPQAVLHAVAGNADAARLAVQVLIYGLAKLAA